jgi:hypothetical protein
MIQRLTEGTIMDTRSLAPLNLVMRAAAALAAVCLLSLLSSGCGDDNDGGNPPPTGTPVATATQAPTDTPIPQPSATPTVAAETPTATPTVAAETPTEAATVTPTPTPLIDQHVELFVGSSQEGGGQLTSDFDFDTPLPLFLNECFDGVGDECTGGTALYTSVNPGIEPLEESDAGASLYVLDDGTPVGIEITAIDPALSMRFEDVTLSQAGDATELGVTPDLHADADTQLLLPGGEGLSQQYAVSFLLKSTAPQYQDSGEYTLHFFPVP